MSSIQSKNDKRRHKSRSVYGDDASDLTNLIINNLSAKSGKDKHQSQTIQKLPATRLNYRKFGKIQNKSQQILETKTTKKHEQLNQIQKKFKTIVPSDQRQLRKSINCAERIQKNQVQKNQVFYKDSFIQSSKCFQGLQKIQKHKLDNSNNYNNEDSNCKRQNILAEQQQSNQKAQQSDPLKVASANKIQKHKDHSAEEQFQHRPAEAQIIKQAHSKGQSQERQIQSSKRRRRSRSQMLLAHKIQALKSFLKENPFIKKKLRAKPHVGPPVRLQEQWKKSYKSYVRLRSTIMKEIQLRRQLCQKICVLGAEQQKLINKKLNIDSGDEFSNSQSSSSSTSSSSASLQRQSNSGQKEQRMKDALEKKENGQQQNKSEVSSIKSISQSNSIKQLCQTSKQAFSKLKKAVDDHLQSLQSQPYLMSYIVQSTKQDNSQFKKQKRPVRISRRFASRLKHQKIVQNEQSGQNKSKNRDRTLKQTRNKNRNGNRNRNRKPVVAKYSLKKVDESSEELSQQNYEPSRNKPRFYINRNALSRSSLRKRNMTQSKQEQKQQNLVKQKVDIPKNSNKTIVRQIKQQISFPPSSNPNATKIQDTLFHPLQNFKWQNIQKQVRQQYKSQIKQDQLIIKLVQQKKNKLSMQPRLVVQSLLFRMPKQEKTPQQQIVQSIKNDKDLPSYNMIKTPKVIRQQIKHYRKHIRQSTDQQEEAYKQFRQFKKYRKMRKLSDKSKNKRYQYMQTETNSQVSSQYEKPLKRQYIRHIKHPKQIQGYNPEQNRNRVNNKDNFYKEDRKGSHYNEHKRKTQYPQ